MKPAFPSQAASTASWRSLGRLNRWLRRLAMLAAGLAILWAAGFGWFVTKVAAERPAAPAPHAEGIVVLTGGADRVAAGFKLLTGGAAPLLLISGAGAGTYLGDFTRRDGIDARAQAPHITLGHAARSTRGNARETARWVTLHHLRSVIVVTADYHMPRALIELHRHLPGTRLYAHPVRPPSMLHPMRGPALRLLAGEFCKYLLVRARLGGFAAHHIEHAL
jgi:uncharacterized SAM-binding protein YcdF (DUF218 family)